MEKNSIHCGITVESLGKKNLIVKFCKDFRDLRSWMVGPPAIALFRLRDRLEALSQKIAIVCQELEVPYLETISVLKRSNVWVQEVT